MSITELEGQGLERMDEAAIGEFLAAQSIGVLGLPAGEIPYLVPMSYAFDGESVYFTYLLGESSRKRRLSEQTDRAGFLVYAAETAFSWRSVLLGGALSAIPEAEYPDEAVRTAAWRPELFERAAASGEIAVYELAIDDRSGIRHTGLPAGFQDTDG